MIHSSGTHREVSRDVDVGAAPLGGGTHLVLVRTQPASRPRTFQKLAKTLAAFVTLASSQLALRRLAREWVNKRWSWPLVPLPAANGCCEFGERAFANTQGTGETRRKRPFARTAMEPRGSTLKRHSRPHQQIIGLARKQSSASGCSTCRRRFTSTHRGAASRP